MFKKLLLVLFVFNVIYAQAQISDTNIISNTPTKYFTGIINGFSTIEHNVVINNQDFSSLNPAFLLGLLFEREWTKSIKISVRPSIILSGVKHKFQFAGDKYEYSYHKSFLEIPFLLMYTFKDKKRFNGLPNYIHIGPVVNYNAINQNISFSRLNNASIRRPVFTKLQEPNLNFGFGYDFKLKYVNLRPEFAYKIGFNALKENTLPNLNLTNVKHNQYTFQVVIANRNRKVVYKKVKPAGPPLWKKIFGSF